jgi:hypothetical protein
MQPLLSTGTINLSQSTVVSPQLGNRPFGGRHSQSPTGGEEESEAAPIVISRYVAKPSLAAIYTWVTNFRTYITKLCRQQAEVI